MRLAPVAVRYWHDAGQRREAASLQSRTTHAARKRLDACVGFSDMLGDAITGMSREQVLADREFDGAPGVAEVLGGSWRGKARTDIRSSGYVIHTLEAAIWWRGADRQLPWMLSCSRPTSAMTLTPWPP